MAECGIDIAGEYPKPWTDEVVRAADAIITMGCGDACPLFPGRRYEERVLDDPAGKTIDDVRPVRDEIERRVRILLDQLLTPGLNGLLDLSPLLSLDRSSTACRSCNVVASSALRRPPGPSGGPDLS